MSKTIASPQRKPLSMLTIVRTSLARKKLDDINATLRHYRRGELGLSIS
jgi:hypothetical protein